IGTESVLQAVVEEFPHGSRTFRMFATGVLDEIPTDSALRACLALMESKLDREHLPGIATAALSKFSTDALEPARRVMLDPGVDWMYTDLRPRLLAVCAAMDVDFPELEQWREDEQNRQERVSTWGQPPPPREDDDDYDYDDDYDDDYDELPLHLPLAREQPKVGRNDPCPCGSGKKFKKCCLNKTTG
ncbi:MAG: SEC-C metal-binding domain-containing protein, partial [Planctomycetales bacterium]